MSCFRCGRKGHWINSCYASTDVNGLLLNSDEEFSSDSGESEEESKHKRVQNPTKRKQRSPSAGVYALVTDSGMEYVGKSKNIDGRLTTHQQGDGAKCLRGAGHLTQVSLLTDGLPRDLESWERDETLTRMWKNGIENVRGWMFVSKTLTAVQKEDAFKQVCERFDLCRKCGRNSHFADACFAKSKAKWAI